MPTGRKWVPNGELWRLRCLGVTGSRSLRCSPLPLLPSQDVGQGRPNLPRKSQHRDFKLMSSCVETLLAPGLKTRPPTPQHGDWKRPVAAS